MPPMAPEQSREGKASLTAESINDPCLPVPWLMGDTALAPSDSTRASTLVPDGESLEVWEPMGPTGALGRLGLQWGRPSLAERGAGASTGFVGSPLRPCCLSKSIRPAEPPQVFTGTGVHKTKGPGHYHPRALPWAPFLHPLPAQGLSKRGQGESRFCRHTKDGAWGESQVLTVV